MTNSTAQDRNPAVKLTRDPAYRGSFGGKYHFTDPDGHRWVVEGTRHSSGYVWMVGIDIDAMTAEEILGFIAAPDAWPSTVVFTLADARAWLAENTPRTQP